MGSRQEVLVYLQTKTKRRNLVFALCGNVTVRELQSELPNSLSACTFAPNHPLSLASDLTIKLLCS